MLRGAGLARGLLLVTSLSVAGALTAYTLHRARRCPLWSRCTRGPPGVLCLAHHQASSEVIAEVQELAPWEQGALEDGGPWELVWNDIEEAPMLGTPVDEPLPRLSAADLFPAFFESRGSALCVMDKKIVARPVDLLGATPPSLQALGLDPTSLEARFVQQGTLSMEEASFLLEQGTRVLSAEPNVLEVRGETVVVGDIHGQYLSLLRIFEILGQAPERQYVFLGDYVDRGDFSCEVFLHLLSLKACYPDRVFLIRGNHECMSQTAKYSTATECMKKYGSKMYNDLLAAFKALPIGVVLCHHRKKGILCIHGGLSPRLATLDDLMMLDRAVEPQHGTLLADILWSDPSDYLPMSMTVEQMEKKRASTPVSGIGPDIEALGELLGFRPNVNRKCSWTYNAEAADAFLEVNGLRGILRAHGFQSSGFKRHFVQGSYGEAEPWSGEGVATVFSACRYRGRSNRGAVLVMGSSGHLEPLIFDTQPEPVGLHSAQEAVVRVCDFLPSTCNGWAELESVTGAGATDETWWPCGLTVDECLAMRFVWEALLAEQASVTPSSIRQFRHTFLECPKMLDPEPLLRALKGPSSNATPENLLRIAACLKLAKREAATD